VRETTTPSAVYPIRIPIPDLNITDPVELNLSGEIIMNATVFDLDCPAYETPGKYRAEVRKMLLDLKNYTGPIPSDYFYDDFDSPGLSERWILRKTGLSSYTYNSSMSRIELYSDVNSSLTNGILMYYSDPFEAPTSNESGYYFTAKMYVDPNAENSTIGILFTTDILDPASEAVMNSSLRGAWVFQGGYLIAMCPDQSIAFYEDISSLLTPGYYDFGYLTNNDTAVFLFGSVPIAECSPQTEEIYISMTSDPLTDKYYGNTSVSLVELFEVQYVEEHYGEKWFDIGFLSYMEYLNNSIYSDVLIFDEDAEGDFYGREFDFEVISDTPGIVDIDELNITYGSLISYGAAGTAPTTSLDQNRDFSWFAVNSEIYGSDMRLNSFAYNSTLTNSEMVLSRIECVNLANSRMVFSGAIYNTEEQYIGDFPLFAFPLEELETDCSGVVENSYLEFVFLIGGNVYNSDVRTLPMMVATDFENAVFDNFTLYEGKMIINGTRIPSLFENELELAELAPIPLPIEEITGGGALPLGCSDAATLAMDGVKLKISNISAASLNCRFELHNSNLNLENLTFKNEFGGIRVSLDNSSTRITNMSELVNVTTYGQLTDVVIWNLNTSMLSGPLVMSSEEIYVETGMASANDSYPETNLTEITSLFQVSLIFNNVAEWDGQVTYYDEFTKNKSKAIEEGIECPPDRCYYSEFDPVAHTLRVDVTNFSTYVVNYTIWNDTNDTSPTPRPRPDRDLEYDLLIEGECAGEQVTFTAIRSGQGVDGLNVNVYGPDSTLSLYDSFETGADGTGSFIPEFAGNYHYQVSAEGYEYKAGLISIIICEAEEEGAEEGPEDGPQAPGEEPETPGWVPECTKDSDCPTGYWCIENECVLAIEPLEEPAPPAIPAEIEIPSAVPEESPVEEEEPAPACCLVGICMDIFGICWYYWAIAVILLLLAAAYLYYFVGEKKAVKQKK
jgi:hypothetical protein